jgi:hypothetical protein
VSQSDPAYAEADALEQTASELEAVEAYNALFSTLSLNTLSVSLDSGHATASIVLESEPPEGAKVIVAFYDENGVLIGIDADVLLTSEGTYVKAQTELAIPEGAASVKAFYWDEWHAPLTPSAKAEVLQQEAPEQS